MKRMIQILPFLLFTAMAWATPDGNSFPDDPGTLMLNVELSAAVIDGGTIEGYEPTGAGSYPSGTSVTITAQTISGYQFVRWSDNVTDNPRTFVLEQSVSLTALYNRNMVEIAIAANKWNFICLPPLGDRQYTEDMFTYDGLSGVKWGTYNGSKRAAGQSGWETPETFNALQGYIIYSTTAGTLRINAYEDEIRQGESSNTIYAGMTAYASSHPENESWNFLGNPFSQGYNIAGLAVAGIESPITVWNGVGYSTYSPGIDSYILNPFEAFFIQKAEGGTEGITFSREYLEGNDGGNGSNVEGALSGYFSVGEGVKVQFSKGNLQYQASTDTWRFAENQYDTIGALNANISSNYDGWIDLFGWGTSGYDNTTSDPFAVNYQPWAKSDYQLNQQCTIGDVTYQSEETNYFGYGPSTFMTDANLTSTSANYDWGMYNTISNGGNKTGQWRTLTYDEWLYIFNDRPSAQYLRSQTTVCGVHGYVLLPDDFTLPEGMSWTYKANDWDTNIYDSQAWSVMEATGAVFLPAAGDRYGSDVYRVDSYGYYWSASYDQQNTPQQNAWRMYFYSDNAVMSNDFRRTGHSVRLVKDVQ